MLSGLVTIPLVGALVLLFLPSNRPDIFKVVAFAFSSVVGAFTIWILTDFQPTGDFQLVDHHAWIEGLGISWSLGIDGISLWLVVLTGLIFPLTIVGLKAESDPKAYFAWLLVLEAGCMGVFLALDLFVFFTFFEIVLVPMYFLISKWGHGRRAYAATKFFIFTMFGSALMLVGILALAFFNQAETGTLTFSLIELANSQSIATNTARWIFLSFALAFAVKVPLFPVHTWLPDAHTNAPTAGSVILAAIMLKLGTYGFLRFGIYLFPEAAVWFAPTLVTLGTIGIIYGAVAATMQKDLKRLVAYSSVAHLGFIVIGSFAINTQGLVGALLQMVNHGISTGALFLLVAMIYERTGTRIIGELGGLQRVVPLLSAAFVVVALSSLGLPGLNGFVGEFLALLGAFAAHRWWAVVAAVGVVAAALYLLWAYQRVFHGPISKAHSAIADLKLREGLVLAPLLAAIIFLGVYPKPVIERMEPAVDVLIAHVEHHVDGFAETHVDGFAEPTANAIAEGGR